MDVVTLGNHLGADQHVERAFVERIERMLEIFASTDRIAIEAADARLGEHAVQQLF